MKEKTGMWNTIWRTYGRNSRSDASTHGGGGEYILVDNGEDLLELAVSCYLVTVGIGCDRNDCVLLDPPDDVLSQPSKKVVSSGI